MAEKLVNPLMTQRFHEDPLSWPFAVMAEEWSNGASFVALRVTFYPFASLSLLLIAHLLCRDVRTSCGYTV